ncbi:MAG: sigma-70 family RNA polymerase sigma factor [Planctomycetota bacterium]
MSDEEQEAPFQLTSLHVRRARDGDPESLTWIVERFSPLILADARYRLGAVLKRLYDPEDLVAEVWAVALPKLAELPARDGRFTPVILKFLSTTLRNKVNNLVQKHILGKPSNESIDRGADDEPGSAPLADDKLTGIVTRAARKEAEKLISEGLDRLGEDDRTIIILRGIEQHPYKAIASVLNEDAKTLSVRYSRALKKLRELLPNSVYDEFIED